MTPNPTNPTTTRASIAAAFAAMFSGKAIADTPEPGMGLAAESKRSMRTYYRATPSAPTARQSTLRMLKASAHSEAKQNAEANRKSHGRGPRRCTNPAKLRKRLAATYRNFAQTLRETEAEQVLEAA